MALRPDIILAGQPIDIVGSMSRGNELAAQTNQLQDQNALRQVYKTQGAGLLSGNQSSLNALAAIDPNLALGVQGGVLQNQTAQRSFEIMNAQEKRAIAEAAAQMDEQQKAEALKSAQAEVLKFVMAPDEATFNQMVTQAGKPELVGMWANRQRLGALYMDDFTKAFETAVGPASDPAVLTDGAPSGTMWIDPNNRALGVKPLPGVNKDPADEYGRYVVEERAAGRQPLSRIDFEQAKKGTETIYGPDGQPILQRGPAGSGKPPTEGQLAGAGYLQRMIGAQSVLDELVAKGVQSIPVAKSLAMDTRAESYVLNPDEQRLAQAQRDWVRAKLRKESGAVIAAEEMASEITTYFPQPGDSPEVIAQKREARLRAERQMEIGSGSAAPLAGDLSAPAPGSGSPEIPPAQAGSTTSQPQGAALPPDLQSIYDKYSTP